MNRLRLRARPALQSTLLSLILVGSGTWAVMTMTQIDQINGRLRERAGNLGLQEQSLESLANALGYAGFLGADQKFSENPSQAAIESMRDSLGQGERALMPLTGASYDEGGGNTVSEVRAILDLYDAEMHRAAAAWANHAPAPAAASNLLMLAAALPELTGRLQTLIANRASVDLKELAALEHRLISLLLVFLAASLVGGVATSRRIEDRYRRPLTLLSRVVAHWRRNSLEFPTPGLERADAVGELARELDLLRAHFRSLPDITLDPQGQQDALRLRFGAQSRGIFEDLIRQLRDAAAVLTSAVKDVKSTQAQAVTTSLELQKTARDLGNSAKTAQTLGHSAIRTNEEIEKLLISLRARVESLAQLAGFTSRELEDALHSVLSAEKSWHVSALESQNVVARFSASADELTDTLVAATSLLRAGGKVIHETADASRNRLSDALDLLHKSNEALDKLVAEASQKIDPILDRSLVAADRNDAISETYESTVERLQTLTGIAGSLTTLVERLDQTMPHIADAVAKVRQPEGISMESISRLNQTLDSAIAATESNSQKVSSLFENGRDQIVQMLERLQQAHQDARALMEQSIKNPAPIAAQQISVAGGGAVAVKTAVKAESRSSILARFRTASSSAETEISRIQKATAALSRTARAILEEPGDEPGNDLADRF